MRYRLIFPLLVFHVSVAAAQDAKSISWKPLPGETFEIRNRPAFLLRPAKAAKGNPWILYAPTFKNSLPSPKDEGWMIEKFLAAGIAVAGIDVGESYGSPTGRESFAALYEELTKNRGLSPKPGLLARSRGGLMAYSWAADNPDKVGCIVGIYPVLDLTTYPGLDRACGAYKMSAARLRETLKEHNPVDRLEPLAKAKVPIFHIHGDKDTVVPYPQNAAEPQRRYKQFGGEMQVVLAKDQGHNMWPGFFRCQELVDFAVKNLTEEKK